MTAQTPLQGTEPPTGRRREHTQAYRSVAVVHLTEPMNGRVPSNSPFQHWKSNTIPTQTCGGGSLYRT